MAVANVPDETEFGGYDYQFTDLVPQRLYCNICTRVLRDPHLTECCGQHFCESCLEHWFKAQKKTTCPHCRQKKFKHILSKPMKREVDELEILCIKQGVGCQWVGELSSLRAHLESDEGCKYADVECSNKCGVMIMRKELEIHLEQQCPLRKMQCQYCYYEDTYQTITTQHYDDCSYCPLPCPNNCGTIGILRRDMANHRSRCVLERVECPFHEAGCTVRVLRREFDVHMSENQQHHLLVLLGEFQETKRELGESQKQLGECQKELGECQRKLGECLRKMGVNRKELRENQTELGKCQRELGEKLDNTAVKLLETRQELEEGKPAAKKILKHLGDKVTFHMTNFSLYKQTGKVWHSPPFYYRTGYKLRLAVYANGKGVGTGTHVSVELLQMKGEHDHKLKWGEQHYFRIRQNISIQIMAQVNQAQPHQAQPQEKIFSLERHLCSQCFTRLPPHEELQVCYSTMEGNTPISEDKFIDHQSAEQLMVLNDTIVLRVT